MHSEGKNKIKIMIETGMPSAKPAKPAPKRMSLIERIEDAMEMIERDENSRHDWLFLRCLNNKLMKLDKLTKKQAMVLKMIQPAIQKFMEYDHKGVEQDSEKLAIIDELT